MKALIFKDTEDNELELFINTNGKIALFINRNKDDYYYCQFFVMDKEEAIEFRKDLNKLIKEL